MSPVTRIQKETQDKRDNTRPDDFQVGDFGISTYVVFDAEKFYARPESSLDLEVVCSRLLNVDLIKREREESRFRRHRSRRRSDTAIIQMQALKAEIKEISLPATKYAVSTYYLIATAEASSNLARYDGVKYGYRAAKEKGLLEMYMKTRQEGFGAEVKRRIMLGTYALSAGYYDAYYGRAQAVRTLIKRDFDEAFKEVDVIVTPTMPTPAFRLGEKIQDPLQMYLSDIYTISVNLAGVPAIVVPCGISSGKLPIGLQIIGRPFEEEKILRAAYAYEQATDWHLKKPAI